MSASGNTGSYCEPVEPGAVTIWTVGHSTRALPEFLDLLRSANITLLGDVRRYPHFNQQPLQEALAVDGVAYLALPELGGRRLPEPDSRNTLWRNASFRGYADYMMTDPFQRGIERVIETARSQRTALMCSESVWWRCHRALIADYLKARGYTVLHLLSPTKHELHPYTAAARIVDGQLSYAPPIS